MVITFWVIQTKAAEEEGPGESRNLQAGTQVRRIVRRKCLLEGLRRILEAPPELPEITDTLLADEGGGHTILQRHQAKVSTLTREQTSFLQAQHRKYRQRLCRDEHVRQHVGAAILAVGLEGCSSKMGWTCGWCARRRRTPQRWRLQRRNRVRRQLPLFPDRRPLGHTARHDPLTCPTHRPSSSRDQAPRTSGSQPHRSVGYRRPHSAAGHRRSSADKAVSAVSKTSRPRHSSFSSWRPIRRRTRVRRTGYLKKRGRRRERLTLYPPLRLIVLCCKILIVLRLPSVKLLRLSKK